MSDLPDPFSKRMLRDDESQLAFKTSQVSQGASLGMRQRRRRIWPFLLVLLLLLGGGIYTYQRFNSSGLPSPAGADGVANFTVGTHPIIVINGASGGINIHTSSIDHVVTLRAVSSASDINNTPIPYIQSSDGRTYTFDVSGFNSDVLDLAVPALTDLQVTTSDGAINVNAVSGQMVLSASNSPITIIGSTLDGSSSLNASDGGLILNTVTFSGGANLVSGNSNVTLTNVNFHGPATLGASGPVALAQDTFADTATLDTSNGGLSVNATTFAGAASLRVESSGSITTANSTFKSTALLNAANGAISLTSTTFAGAVTVTDAGTFTTTQAAFQAGAIVKTSDAMNISATFGAQGNYQFITTNSDIDLTLSSDLSFHLDASTTNGSISSDFPAIRVATDPNLPNAAQAHGDVGLRGNQPKLKFTLTVDNGDVRIHSV
jgi:putative adhesin